ncbi:MAG TPA: PKD domain-containing protein [candidate division Zixibacteria bacterium]|nr:PKD domain-containing protein [candidate division Zixibacteria bacterium]
MRPRSVRAARPGPSAALRGLGRHRRSLRGQSLVEFALLLPLFVLFLVIAVDFGRVFFTYIQMTNAAREAAYWGTSAPDRPADEAGMLAKAQAETNAQGQGGEGGIDIEVECRDPGGTVIPCSSATGGAGAGNLLTVTVSQPFSFLTPLVDQVLGAGFTMRTSATATVLGFAANGSGSGGPTGTCSLPTASFTVIVVSGTTVEVDPADSTPQTAGDPCNISGYFWYWGNGEDQPGTATATTYTYPSPGTYTITLEVTNQAGLASTTRTVTVPEGAPPSCEPPNASFTFTTSGPGSKTHTYVDTSTVDDPVNCPITAWLWTFGDGTQSNAPAPTAVTYRSASKHTTTLTVTNSSGSDTFSWNH